MKYPQFYYEYFAATATLLDAFETIFFEEANIFSVINTIYCQVFLNEFHRVSLL